MPTLQLFTNNAYGRLAAPLNTLDTTLALEAGQGAYFPSPAANEFFYLTLVDSSSYIEIVKCTARAGDNFTIERAQEATTPRAFATGDICELRITADTMARLAQRDAVQTISGNWTFQNNIIVPVVPTANGHAASKQYVDQATGGGHDHAGETLGPVYLRNGSTGITQPAATSNTLLATTAFVQSAIAAGASGWSLVSSGNVATGVHTQNPVSLAGRTERMFYMEVEGAFDGTTQMFVEFGTNADWVESLRFSFSTHESTKGYVQWTGQPNVTTNWLGRYSSDHVVKRWYEDEPLGEGQILVTQYWDDFDIIQQNITRFRLRCNNDDTFTSGSWSLWGLPF
jgi:hypothetical protein